jgi:hypothetical protein
MYFMKANGTRFFIIAVLAELLFLLITFTVKAQPEFDFSNSSLVAGTQRTRGAVYRFTQVRPNVDALVTIADLTGGVTLSDIDGGSGFRRAFQPVLQVPGHSNGYAEFSIRFVIANTILPSIQLEVPVTPIDVDGQTYGSGRVFEYDQIQNLLGLATFLDFALLGGELNLNLGQNWLTGRNTAAIDYPGVDTLARQAMFTVVAASVLNMTIRVGADNQSNGSVQRLRSVYFRRFSYPHSYLAKPALAKFTGVEKDKKVELQWQLSTDNQLSKVIVEKGVSTSQFNTIGEVPMSNDGTRKTNFNYTDNSGINAVAYYRLKMIGADGALTYSNILTFRSSAGGSQPFKVYPSVVNSSVTVTVKGDKTGAATFQLLDYAGRVVKQQNIIVQEGNNNVVVDGLGSFNTGNYLVSLKTIDNQVHTQKIFKQ